MRERHNRTDKRCGLTAGGAAAVVFCLAGTPVGLAQSTPPETAPALRNPLAAPSPSGTNDKVKVDEHMIVDLHVNDEDLSNVLQMLSIQSQKNIVTSRNVSAVVTANLYGVTFYEALDAILHVNGYGYIERGNFIYVYTLEELNQIEAAQRVRISRVFRLNYLSGVDAAEFIKPLLSENGQIKTNGRAGSFSDSGSMTGEDFASESTLLIHDFEENIAEMERVLKELDTRPSQVLIEATILQTALTEANAFGVDFSVIGDMDFGDFLNLGGPLKVVDSLISGAAPVGGDTGQGAVSNVGGTAGPASFKLGIVQNDVAAFLRLLDEVSDTTILSRPNLTILNRSTGRVLVGRKVGYLSTTSTDTATTQTVEFLDTGTQLIVRPFVGADGMIKMELKPKVSEAVIRNTTTAGGQAVTIPDEISNELTTTVMVRDGHTIVLGGLFRESTQASRRQVPFAGDLPIIGAAFRGHDDEVQRSEVIFMITPSVVADNVLIEQGRRAEASVDQVRAGSRQGLLPWSRDRRTQQMLVQAQTLARAGDNEGALYKVNRALRLNKFQPDAIALREQLLQKRENWPTRSMQKEIITGEIEGLVGSGHSSIMPMSRPMSQPALTVEVETDAGGVTWFEDDGDAWVQEENEQGSPAVPSSTTPNATPAPTNKQATATEEPIAWIMPEDNLVAPEVTFEIVPETTASASNSNSGLSTTVPPSPATWNVDSGSATWSTAQEQPSGSFNTQSTQAPNQNSTIQTPTQASTQQPMTTSSQQASSRSGSRQAPPAQLMQNQASQSANQQANQQASSSVNNSSTTSNPVASSGGAWIPGTADPAPAGTLRANPQQQVRTAPAQNQPQQASNMWSSALASALEESGESFDAGTTNATAVNTSAGSNNQSSHSAPAVAQQPAAAPVKPGQELVWSPAPSSGGDAAVFSSFQTMWDLFRTYSERTTNTRTNSTVTSVPTEGGSR